MKIRPEDPLGVVTGVLFAGWLAFGYSHLDAKILNLVLFLVLAALWAIGAALVNATAEGGLRQGRMHIGTAVGFLLTLAVITWLR